MIVAGSFHFTRTNGIVSVVEMASSMWIAVSYSISPCCVSITSQSKSMCAIASALKAELMLNHPPTV